MVRKETAIALITFCLTATLFSIIPVGSQGIREYDPWFDINDDGKIDLKDYYGVGLKYGTEGDPTKNVNVTNWPNWASSGELMSSLFPEKLTLVGGFAFHGGVGEGILFIQDTPRVFLEDIWANVADDGVWHLVLNITFLQIEYAEVAYNLTDRFMGNIRVGVANNNAYGSLDCSVRGAVTVGKRMQNNTDVNLYAESLNQANVRVGQSSQQYFSRTFSGSISPRVRVEKGERLFLRVGLEAQTGTYGAQVGISYDAQQTYLMVVFAVKKP